MEKQTNTPQLRFPEFMGEWKMKPLGGLLEFKNGINASKEQYGSGYKFINVLDILNNDFITHDKIIGSVNVDEETVNKYPVSYGDILFQRSSETREEVGSASVYLDKQNIATFGGFVIRGRKIGDYDPVFLNKLLKTDASRDSITSKSGGSTRYNVGQEILSSVKLYFPEIPEQEKIGSFFTLIDEKIKSLKKKHSLLDQYKKGVMQKLFSRELRFKDESGNEFPDWVEKKFGDTLEIVIDNRGKTPPVEKSGIPLLEVNSIGSKEVNYNAVSKFVNQETFDNWFRKHLKSGDVLFSTVGNTALCSYYDRKHKAVIAQNIVGFRFTNELGLFMYYLLTEENNYNKMKAIEMGAVQPSIKVSQLTELFFKIPTKSEQIKISEFLYSLDKKIEVIKEQIDQVEIWKKGLLQKMFC